MLHTRRPVALSRKTGRKRLSVGLALFALVWATCARSLLAFAGPMLGPHQVSFTFADGHLDLVLHHGAAADHGCGGKASGAEISTPLHQLAEHHGDHVVHLCAEAPFVSKAIRADLDPGRSWVAAPSRSIAEAPHRVDHAPERPPGPNSARTLHSSIILLV